MSKLLLLLVCLQNKFQKLPEWKALSTTYRFEEAFNSAEQTASDFCTYKANEMKISHLQIMNEHFWIVTWQVNKRTQAMRLSNNGKAGSLNRLENKKNLAIFCIN